MTPKKSVLTAAMVGAFVVGASACGSDGGHFDGKSAAEIAEESRKSMLELTSMSLKAEIADGEDMTKIDTSFTEDGECSGSITMAAGDAEFLTVGGVSYLKAGDGYWDEQGLDGAEINAQLDGRWIEMGSDQNSYAAFCQMDSFLSELEESEVEEDEWKSADGKKINGTSTVGLVREDDDGTTTMYVADSSDAYIVRMDREGDDGGYAEFSDFDKDFDFTAPADDEIVTFEELSQLG